MFDRPYSESVSEFVAAFTSPVIFDYENFASDGVVPVYSDLTALPSEDLGKYSSYLRGYSTLLSEDFLVAEATLKYLESQESRVAAIVTRDFSLENPKATATAIKNAAPASLEYAAIHNQVIGAELKLSAIVVRQRDIENIIASISREYSRRFGKSGQRDEAY